MKIALGTVQFGVSYGVGNKRGQVKKNDVKKILNYVEKNGIYTLDTAISYGSSEKVLGEIGVDNFNVITKLPEIPNNCKNLESWVNENVNSSLNRLRVESVYGLLLHRPNQLLNPCFEGLWNILQDLKKNKVIKKIGFSIYDPSELKELFGFFKPDLIQAPYNVFDRRLKASGWLKQLHANGVEIHIRSVFLQGLLLMNKKERPNKFNKWIKLWNEWEDWLRLNETSPIEAAMSFVLSEDRISKVIIGVDSLNQIEEIIAVVKNNKSSYPKNFSIKDNRLINPSQWNSL